MLIVHTLPMLRNNYGYVLECEERRTAFVIDPSDARPVLDLVQQRRLKLKEIWLTHHHWDHVGGIRMLLNRLGPMTVLASQHDLLQRSIRDQTAGVSDLQTWTFEGHSVQAFAVPGHTWGATAFMLDNRVFTGDTLFLAGCGRVCTGNMELMHRSLMRLAALPHHTKIYCGHEYTEANLRFALHAEPDNIEIQKELQELNIPSIPGTIERQREVNPFLRCDQPSIQQRWGQTSIAAFTALRKAKDRFRS